MLTDYFEDFLLLLPLRESNGMGGTAETWQEHTVFRGGVTHALAKEEDISGLMAVKTLPVLVHEWDVTLAPGNRVKRVRDGAEYRVLGSSGDMRTPSIAGLSYCQVPVERLVRGQ